MTNLLIRSRLLQKQLYGNTAIVRAALISFEQLAVWFVLCFKGGEGNCLFGFFKISSRYKSGSKQSVKK